jgi:RNA-directed DNA polymerase
VSPLLANLFLHYTFDAWARRELPEIPFCRYADDGLLHCRSRYQAEYVMRRISERFRQCGLEIHPDKSSIVYCKDGTRTGDYSKISFDFLGYTFRPRRATNLRGQVFMSFLPAISRESMKEVRHHPQSGRLDEWGCLKGSPTLIFFPIRFLQTR